MGCFSKFEKKVCPTDEDSAAAETAAPLGTGKLEPGDESGIETTRHGNEPHVTPEMEASEKVGQETDSSYYVSMCAYSFSHGNSLANFFRHALIFGPLQHWVTSLTIPPFLEPTLSQQRQNRRHAETAPPLLPRLPMAPYHLLHRLHPL